MDKDLHEKLIKNLWGGAGGVFVCACEQKELRDIVSRNNVGQGTSLGCQDCVMYS